MQITMKAEGKRAVVRLSGRFDFSANREFRASIDAALQNPEVGEGVADLAGVD